MKAIKAVTEQEVKYVDDDGIIRSIDLINCNRNWLAHERISGEEIDELDKKYVGWRNVCSTPPCIIFFTKQDPYAQNTTLQFDYSSECNVTDERFWVLLEELKKVGWRTIDLS